MRCCSGCHWLLMLQQGFPAAPPSFESLTISSFRKARRRRDAFIAQARSSAARLKPLCTDYPPCRRAETALGWRRPHPSLYMYRSPQWSVLSKDAQVRRLSPLWPSS